MNCSEVQKVLPDYLANEVPTSVRKLIQAHLSACPGCQKSLEEQAALQRGLRHRLHAAAESVSPSQEAWSRLAPQLTLKPGLQSKTKPAFRFSSVGWALMGKPLAVAFILIAILAGTIAFVPPVRAQMQAIFAGRFGFASPSGNEHMALETVWTFIPSNPTYLPDGYRHSATLTAGETGTETFGMLYTQKDGGGFIALLQSAAPLDSSLPAGEARQVRSRPAVLQRGADIDLQDQPEGKRQWIENYLALPGVQRLTWNEAGVQFDLISNLPEREQERIASSLVPAEEDGMP